MTPWLALSLGVLLGQTPEMTPSLPPDADTQDPAAIEFRDAWERALTNTDATDQGQDSTDGTLMLPVLEVGGTPESARSVPVTTGASAQQATGLDTSGTGGAGTQGTSADGTQATQSTASSGSQTGATGNTRQEVEQLRAQVQSLQAQLAAQQEESTSNAQQLTGMQERAAELERMRQQRLSELERARSWLVAADQALEVGELAIGDALGEADTALEQVLQSASSAGSGQTVVLIEDARSLIAQALESTGHRDTYQARRHLLDADWRVREARRQNLDSPSATVVTQ